MYSNVTGPDVVRGQMGGTLTGGGLYLRSPRKTVQLFSMDPPRYSVGCGGIDAYMGSFSFISGEKLTQFIRAVAQQAPPLLFKLAIQGMSPQLDALLTVFQKMAQDMNAMNLNSCSIAQGIRNGETSTVLGRLSKTMGDLDSVITGYHTDYQNALEKNLANAQAAADRSMANRDAANQPKETTIGNFTWKAIKRSDRLFSPPPITDNADEGNEILMSLLGSQIVANAEQPKPIYPSLRLKDLLESKATLGQTKPTIKVMKCDDQTDCLNPSLPRDLPFEGVAAYINRKMFGGYEPAILPGSIVDRLLVCAGADCGLDASQKAFLNGYSNIPVTGILVKLQRQPNVGKQIAGELASALAAEAEHMYVDFLLSRMQLLYQQDPGMKWEGYDAKLREMAEDARALDAKKVSALSRLNTIFAYMSSVAKGSQPVKK